MQESRDWPNYIFILINNYSLSRHLCFHFLYLKTGWGTHAVLKIFYQSLDRYLETRRGRSYIFFKLDVWFLVTWNSFHADTTVGTVVSHWLWCLIVVLASAISANSQAFWPNTLPSAFRRKQTKVLIQGQVTLGFSSWWQIVVCLRRKWRAHEKWHCSISSNLGTGKTWARRLILFLFLFWREVFLFLACFWLDFIYGLLRNLRTLKVNNLLFEWCAYGV